MKSNLKSSRVESITHTQCAPHSGQLSSTRWTASSSHHHHNQTTRIEGSSIISSAVANNKVINCSTAWHQGVNYIMMRPFWCRCGGGCCCCTVLAVCPDKLVTIYVLFVFLENRSAQRSPLAWRTNLWRSVSAGLNGIQGVATHCCCPAPIGFAACHNSCQSFDICRWP